MTAKVPLDWAAPSDAQIDYFVQRARAPKHATRALVFVAGGPGASGDGGIAVAARIQALVPDMDVVAPDHRGAGHSTWFGCDPANPSKDLTVQCLQEVEDKYGADAGTYFSTTQAAKDLHFLINSLRAEGLRISIYGESYGTFLVNRLLQLYPADVDAVVMDSTVRPDGHEEYPSAAIDLPPNHVAHDIFTACAQDAFCSGKLGQDPWTTLGSLEQKLAGGFCPSGPPAGTADPVRWLKTMLFDLEGTSPGATQTAFVYRLNRCSAADVQAIAHALWHATPTDPDASGEVGSGSGCVIGLDGGARGTCAGGAPDGGAPTAESAARGANQLLQMNIAFSDSWSVRPSATAFEQADQQAYVSDPSKLQFFATLSLWPFPPYNPGTPLGWAATDVPLLILEGSLDPKDPPYPIADARTAFTAPHQQMVVVPNAVHVVLEHSSPTPSTGGRTCGLDLVANFLANSTAQLDMRCTTEIPPLDFRGDPATAQTVFGTADLYE